MPAPDLRRAFAILDLHGDNQWRTQILCALSRETQGEISWSYLTKECRSEDIFADRGKMIRSNSYEFCVAIVWGEPHFLRGGSFLYRAGGKNEQPARVAKAGIVCEVVCPEADTKNLGFDSCLQLLADPNRYSDDLYLALRWSSGDFGYCLYIPYLYANFNKERQYIQVQTGPALFPMNGAVEMAYMAASLSPSGVDAAEFCMRLPTPYLETKRDTGLFKWIKPLLVKSGISDLFFTDQYSRLISVDAEYSFYRYKEARPSARPQVG